jgi:glycosyltransferase involved in cell wall biosynthesis
VSSATLPTELARGLQERGLEVGVVCGYPQEYVNDSMKSVPVDDELNGITIKRVKYTTFNNKSKFGRIFNFFSLFLAMTTKLFYLKKFKKIIVYSNPPIMPLIPLALKKIFKTEFIFIAFDIYPDNALEMKSIKKNGVIHRFMNFINNKVYAHASSVVLLGNEMKTYVIKNNIAKREDNLKVIPNWFSDEKALQNTEIINESLKGINSKYKFTVLYSGNMGSSQDMETILQGILEFKNHEEICFVFSGHGNKLEYVKNFLSSNNIKNSQVFGFLTGQDYSDILNISDLCIVSLEKGIEGLGVPSKTYGYLAAGKPVLSIMNDETDIAKDLYEYKCGVNIIQEDILGFRNAVNSYFNDPELVKTESRNARELYESKYTKKININKYYDLVK